MYPRDRLTILCRKGLGAYLLQAGLIDEAIEVDKSKKTSWHDAERILKAKSFDLLLSPHESFRSAWLVLRLKARHKIGYARFFNRFVFHERIERPMHLPEALRQLALLVPLSNEWGSRLQEYERTQGAPGGQMNETGDLTDVPSWASMSVVRLSDLRANIRSGVETEIALADVSSEKVRQLFIQHQIGSKPTAFLAPGSVWPTKMWTTDGFTRVARELQGQGYSVFLMGSASERAICDEIVFRAPGAVSLAGETSLYESAELLAAADLLVCNDSGAMHMAATAGVPSVAVFGPTVLRFGYRPWQNRARVVQEQEGLACRPCGKHGARVCPLGTHECMKSVSADRVLKAAQEVLT